MPTKHPPLATPAFDSTHPPRSDRGRRGRKGNEEGNRSKVGAIGAARGQLGLDTIFTNRGLTRGELTDCACFCLTDMVMVGMLRNSIGAQRGLDGGYSAKIFSATTPHVEVVAL